MSSRTVLALVAAALVLAACGKKEEPKATSANLPPVATTPGTPPAGTQPGSTTQPTSAEPSTDKPPATGSVAPRNYVLGTAIGPDKKVTVVTDTLTTKETPYVSVDLFGAGEAKVRAVWNRKDAGGNAQVVRSDTETVKLTAPKSVEFHLAQADVTPGQYEVELFVNEASSGKKKFTVK